MRNVTCHGCGEKGHKARRREYVSFRHDRKGVQYRLADPEAVYPDMVSVCDTRHHDVFIGRIGLAKDRDLMDYEGRTIRRKDE